VLNGTPPSVPAEDQSISQ